MILKRYNQFINESKVDVDDRLPSYDDVVNYFQSVDDEYRMQILYSYTNRFGKERINHLRGPEGGVPYFTLSKDCYMDAYVVYIFADEDDENIISEVKHIIDNIKLDSPKILTDCSYNDHNGRFQVYITYNKNLIDVYINTTFPSKLLESANNTQSISPEQIQDYFQPLFDEMNNRFLLVLCGKSANSTGAYKIDSDNDIIEDRVGYLLSLSGPLVDSTKEIDNEVSHIFDNILVDFPNVELVYTNYISNKTHISYDIYICWKFGFKNIFHNEGTSDSIDYRNPQKKIKQNKIIESIDTKELPTYSEVENYILPLTDYSESFRILAFGDKEKGSFLTGWIYYQTPESIDRDNLCGYMIRATVYNNDLYNAIMIKKDINHIAKNLKLDYPNTQLFYKIEQVNPNVLKGYRIINIYILQSEIVDKVTKKDQHLIKPNLEE